MRMDGDVIFANLGILVILFLIRVLLVILICVINVWQKIKKEKNLHKLTQCYILTINTHWRLLNTPKETILLFVMVAMYRSELKNYLIPAQPASLTIVMIVWVKHIRATIIF